jgi:hypothetical protein
MFRIMQDDWYWWQGILCWTGSDDVDDMERLEWIGPSPTAPTTFTRYSGWDSGDLEWWFEVEGAANGACCNL